jgi:hypothetical protein
MVEYLGIALFFQSGWNMGTRRRYLEENGKKTKLVDKTAIS